MNQDTKNAMAEIFAEAQKGLDTTKKFYDGSVKKVTVSDFVFGNGKAEITEENSEIPLAPLPQTEDSSVIDIIPTDESIAQALREIHGEVNPDLEILYKSETDHSTGETKVLHPWQQEAVDYSKPTVVPGKINTIPYSGFANPVKPTKQSEIEGNQKIALFLGGELSTHPDPTLNMVFGVIEPGGQILSYFVNELTYHKDWNHLMYAADKIQNLSGKGVIAGYVFGGRECSITYMDLRNVKNGFSKTAPRTNGLTTIQNAWLCILEFIDWYNLLTK